MVALEASAGQGSGWGAVWRVAGEGVLRFGVEMGIVGAGGGAFEYVEGGFAIGGRVDEAFVVSICA